MIVMTKMEVMILINKMSNNMINYNKHMNKININNYIKLNKKIK
jgi:hypothetical protein